MSKPTSIKNPDSRAESVKATQLRMAVNMPVSVWVEGEDPTSAVAGQVFLVGRNFLRVRVPKVFPPGTRVRFKTQARSRSLCGEIRGASHGKEAFISSEGAAAYFGITFPSSQETSEPAPGPESPSKSLEAEGEVAAEPPAEQQAEPATEDEPPPVPPARTVSAPETGAALSRQLPVVVSGIDAARSSFSQAAMAALDASGTCYLELPQVLELGSRVRLRAPGQATPEGGGANKATPEGGAASKATPEGVAASKERTWNCRVYSLGVARTREGRWSYRLVFEETLDLFREFEPLLVSGPTSAGTDRLLLGEINALRSAMVALLYELRQRSILTDDKLLSDLLGRPVPLEP